LCFCRSLQNLCSVEPGQHTLHIALTPQDAAQNPSPGGSVPSSKILHSRRSFLLSSSRPRSIAWLRFFWSPSSLLLLDKQAPMLPVVCGGDRRPSGGSQPTRQRAYARRSPRASLYRVGAGAMSEDGAVVVVESKDERGCWAKDEARCRCPRAVSLLLCRLLSPDRT